MKKVLAPILVLLAVGCASTSMRPSSSSAGSASPASRPAGARADAYVLLSAPNQVRELALSNVRDFHINGTMTTRGFLPLSQVEGSGNFCSEGKDWLELTNLTVHRAGDSKTPSAPYVLGCATTAGFQPASRDIVLQ
jgi:hypothetical protein